MIGKKNRPQPTLFIPGSMEDFIPEDHILKRVDHVLDLSWLAAEVANTYSEDTGRPGVAPEAAVRLMLAGFFHGIVHDRKLMREAQVNIAIRWFAGYGLDEPLPDHSSLTRIRQRWGEERFRRIFEKTVAACAAAGLVGGETLHVDATLIRANVSWESLTEQHAQAVIDTNGERQADSEQTRPPDNKKSKPGRPSTSEKQPKKRSATDPDATLSTSCKTHRMEPCYKQHTAVDDAAGVIVDVEVTTGEASEGERLTQIIDRVERANGKPVERVTADAGYAHSRNYSACEQRGIDAVIPPQKSANTSKAMPSSRFKYDAKHQRLRCPAGHDMTHSRRVEKGTLFRMDARTCSCCALRSVCFSHKSNSRMILIVDGYEALLRARRRHACWDDETAQCYSRHRWLVEGVHGEAKEQHGLRRAVRRGLDNVAIQSYLAAAVINLKRLAAFIFGFLLPITSQGRLSAVFSNIISGFSIPRLCRDEAVVFA